MFVGNGFKRSLVQKYFFESLDELEETVHNLTSLLLTNLTRRRSESYLKIWTTDRCGCLDAKRRKSQKVLKAITRMERSIEVEVKFYRQ